MKMLIAFLLVVTITPSAFAVENENEYVDGPICIGKMLNRKVSFQSFLGVSKKADHILITFFNKAEKFYYIPGSTRDTYFSNYESKFMSNNGDIAILETTASGLLLTTVSGKTFLKCET
jgi:hypothetical protein